MLYARRLLRCPKATGRARYCFRADGVSDCTQKTLSITNIFSGVFDVVLEKKASRPVAKPPMPLKIKRAVLNSIASRDHAWYTTLN